MEHHNVRAHPVSDSYSDYRGGSPLVRAQLIPTKLNPNGNNPPPY
jgi:hypothetical protein